MQAGEIRGKLPPGRRVEYSRVSLYSNENKPTLKLLALYKHKLPLITADNNSQFPLNHAVNHSPGELSDAGFQSPFEVVEPAVVDLEEFKCQESDEENDNDFELPIVDAVQELVAL